MSAEKIDQLYNFCQERYLWQFFSRTWDRQENIDGIVRVATALLTGQPVSRETPMDRLFYADARIMADDFKARFPWILEASADEIGALLGGLKERLVEIAITKSLNHELNHTLY
jgi:nitrogenase delta subunit